MKNFAEKKNEDLENIRKKIDELVGYAWERGYKFGQDDQKEPIEEEHEFCVGDIVKHKTLENKGIILGLTRYRDAVWASVYTGVDVPQMLPLEDLVYIGKNVNVQEFFNSLKIIFLE